MWLLQLFLLSIVGGTLLGLGWHILNRHAEKLENEKASRNKNDQ